MAKLWDFVGNGKDYVSDYMKLLKEYKDSLNEQQGYLICKLDLELSINSDFLIKVNVSDKLYTNVNTIFTIVVKPNGLSDLYTHYYNKRDEIKNNDIKTLESKLDEKIKSKELGSLLSFYISLAKGKERYI